MYDRRNIDYFKPFAILSFIFGALSLILLWFPYTFPASIMSFGFSLLGKKTINQKLIRLIKIGRIFAIIGLIINLIFSAITFYINFLMPMLELIRM